jgi:7-cyano-7-deazaguanine reductase
MLRPFYCIIGPRPGQLFGGMNGLMAGTSKSRPQAAQRDGHQPAPPGGAQVPSGGPQLEIRDPREVRPGVLETFPYEYPGSPATVEISTDEFTAVCPWSGLPDFGTVTVRYLPRDRVLELRSFKYYLLSYRNVGIYQEHAANRMLSDLVAACAPDWLELVLDYRIRGGVHTVVRVRWPSPAS